MAGNVVTANSVGTIRVRVVYPATERFQAGSAEADINVLPKPISFGLGDQDFEFDGTIKTAVFTVSDPAALAAGMIDTTALHAGPVANIYPVSINAFGNYTGSASATVRIWPHVDRFVFNGPNEPQASITATPAVQWPASGTLQWTTSNSDAVTVTSADGAVISTLVNGSTTTAKMDVRATPYAYSITAAPLPGSASFTQQGGITARLQGPELDVDVTNLASYPISKSGVYTYTTTANGLSRSASFTASLPAPARSSATITVTPATVTGEWISPRRLDGPYQMSAGDFPTWKIQTGESVAGETHVAWTRTDDGAVGDAPLASSILPGSYNLTASFVPPNANYSAPTVTATWHLTVPLTITASNATVSVNGVARQSGAMLRILPGDSVRFSASPSPDFSWGSDWETAAPQIWSGSRELIPDSTRPSFTSAIPAGLAALSINASAYQLGPRVVELTPMPASFTVTSGPAAGRTYQRSWQGDGGWSAYLARDGVVFSVSGESRESSISRFEIQAKPPAGDWFTLAQGSPSAETTNGPRVRVPQTFSVRLGETNPQKPLVPADLNLAGLWQIRARVQSSTGAWSGWSDEQALNVLVPIQTVSIAGRTLPPVKDAAWFKPSATKNYSFEVWIP
ncbi:MAG TPA: hypothetical protein VFT72_15710 [Opitutaceae bacterium]|nr:hypothetical protein [Opitutaceae bacterium]